MRGAFTRVTTCILALSSIHDTHYPKVSGISLLQAWPSCCRRRSVAAQSLHPLKSTYLSRRTPAAAVRAIVGSSTIVRGAADVETWGTFDDESSVLASIVGNSDT